MDDTIPTAEFGDSVITHEDKEMSRSFALLVCSVTLWAYTAYSDSVFAQGVKGFFHSIKVDAVRNACWPDAFVPADRTNARLPFVIMVHNGWKRQNLIADHYFAEDGKTLTDAGKRQVQWIVTQAPLSHRAIYVKEGEDATITEARVKAVGEVASKYLGPEQKPDIRVTNISPPGWPAELVDTVERAYLKTMPDPRLPARSSNSEAQVELSN